MHLRDLPDLLRDTLNGWLQDDAARLGAALAYYTVLSIAPLLVLVTAVVGLVWSGQSASVQAVAVGEIRANIGPEAAEMVARILENMEAERAGGIVATALGALGLLFGATTVFAQLQGALNHIWNVRRQSGQGVKGFVRTRLVSFGMVLVVGFLLLVSLVASTVVSFVAQQIAIEAPGIGLFWRLVTLAVSFGLISLLFATIYRVLPDVEVRWRDVWVGAVVTALLFVLGKWALSLYLARSSPASAYGAVGSFVVLLIWVYYSAQLFFFGAEFTQVWAQRYGKRIRPAPYASRYVPKSATVDAAPTAAAPEVRTLPEAPPAGRRVRGGRWRVPLLVAVAFAVGRFFGRRS